MGLTFVLRLLENALARYTFEALRLLRIALGSLYVCSLQFVIRLLKMLQTSPSTDYGFALCHWKT